MVDEETLPDPGPRVYLYPGEETVKVRYKATHKFELVPPEKAGHAVKPDGMKTRITEDYLPPVSGRRVPDKYCPHIFSERFKQLLSILLT
jgi:hypothetical protein